MKYLSNKRSQITIFIILGLIVLFLLLFLISTSFSQKEDDVLKTKENLIDPDLKIIPLKENVDYCLERELRRTLMIAGIRGGFIYDRGEYYFPTGFVKEYGQELLSNMEINLNAMKTLVHFHEDIYTPGLNYTTALYSHTIENDFEEFMLEEFMDCISLDDYEDQGYEIIYEDYQGEIQFLNNDLMKVDDMDAEIGDKVRITLSNYHYFGDVVAFDDQNFTVVQFPPDTFKGVTIPQEFDEIPVVNFNNSVSLDVIFKEEEVAVDLFFPIKIKKDGDITSYQNAYNSVNVRFVKLLELSNSLLVEKKLNRQYDFFSKTDLNKALINPYLKNTDLENLDFKKTVYNDTDENKKFIYEFVDHDSKIYGKPFIFRFGYENNAPEIDLTKLGSTYISDDIMVLTSVNNRVTLSLLDATHDSEGVDPIKRHFIEYTYNGPDAYFRVSPQGTVEFEAYQQKRYNFEITTTDHEAKRTRTYQFIAGYGDNSNNSNAYECFYFENDGAPGLFPVDDDYKRLKKYTDSSGKSQVFGYQIYRPGVVPKTRMKFSCNYFGSNANEIIKINGNPVTVGADGYFEIPMTPSVQTITVDLISTADGSVIGNQYEVKVYPAMCLGPKPISILDQQAMYNGLDLGGEATCCDTRIIDNSINAKSPGVFVGAQSNILNAVYAANKPMYFCFDDTNGRIPGYNWDFVSRVTSGSLDEETGSLFQGTLRARCRGNYPMAFHDDNLEGVVGGTDYRTLIKRVRFGQFVSTTSKPFEVKKIYSAGVYGYCTTLPIAVFPVGLYILDSQNVVFAGGLS